MSKTKKDINQNFEMLKAQMQAKRKKAETQSVEEVTNSEVTDIKKDNAKEAVSSKTTTIEKEIPILEEVLEKPPVAIKPQSEIQEELIEEVVINEEDILAESYNDTTLSEEIAPSKKPKKRGPKPKKEPIIETYEEEEDDDYYSLDEEEPIVTTTTDGSIKIKIKRQEKPEAPRRATYYLKQETIRKIERVSKMSGIGKSKLVQLLLDQALDNLEIEK